MRGRVGEVESTPRRVETRAKGVVVGAEHARFGTCLCSVGRVRKCSQYVKKGRAHLTRPAYFPSRTPLPSLSLSVAQFQPFRVVFGPKQVGWVAWRVGSHVLAILAAS